MKHILVTGANSYIGVSFEKWADCHYHSEFHIETIDMINDMWRKKNFSFYDCVFHVAGIAHADVGNVNEEIKAKYYKVNRDLAIETAKKARDEGVRQFVFMSSAIVYGDCAPCGQNKRITIDTEPKPNNFYGDSKWQADRGVRELETPGFGVAVLRPPMIYGRGSKGNYPILAKLIKWLPVFPDVENERSMLYIDNLCEFLCQIMKRGKSGIFFPQNAEYTRTSEMARMIAEANDHKISVNKSWNWVICLASHIPGKIGGLANKAFGNMSYDQSMSEYDFNYQVTGLKESIRETER